MKRKILISLLAATAIIASAFGFAGCFLFGGGGDGGGGGVNITEVTIDDVTYTKWSGSNYYQITKIDRTDETCDNLLGEVDGLPVKIFNCTTNNYIKYLTMPEGITEIAMCPFFNLREVSLPDSLQKIHGFDHCSQLTSITIPENVTEISWDCFRDCSKLEEVNYNAINAQASGGGDILSNAGENTNGITLKIGSQVKSIGNSMFRDNSYLKRVVSEPNSVLQTIGADVFYDCENLTEVVLPETITSVGHGAFHGCGNIVKAEMPAEAFNQSESKKFPSAIVTSGNEGVDFRECPNLVSVEFKNNATKAGGFSNCPKLKTITYGKGITEITSTVIKNCPALETINFNAVQCADITAKFGDNDRNNAGDSEKGATVNIGAEVKNIPAHVFHNLTVNSVTIAQNSALKTIGDYAVCNTGITEFDIPDGVTAIGKYAFSNTDVTALTLPQGVTAVSDNLAYLCKNLETVTLQGNVLTIGKEAFRECVKLSEITLPDSLTAIGNSAFQNCTSITNLDLHSKITGIGEYAFAYTGITELTLPKGITEVSNQLARGCTKLKTVSFAEYSVAEKIGNFAFYGCSKLSEVTLPDSLTSIGKSAFYNCTNITEIVLPDNVTAVGELSFGNCSKLGNITFGSKLMSFGEDAFKNVNPVAVFYRGDIESWCAIDFANEYSTPHKVNAGAYICRFWMINSGSNSQYHEVKEITIPNTVTVIKPYTFAGLTLEKLIIKQNVITVSASAFANSKINIFYEGTEATWDNTYSGAIVQPSIIYYYSSDKPDLSTGNYWHYDTNDTPTPWTIYD